MSAKNLRVKQRSGILLHERENFSAKTKRSGILLHERETLRVRKKKRQQIITSRILSPPKQGGILIESAKTEGKSKE